MYICLKLVLNEVIILSHLTQCLNFQNIREIGKEKEKKKEELLPSN